MVQITDLLEGSAAGRRRRAVRPHAGVPRPGTGHRKRKKGRRRARVPRSLGTGSWGTAFAGLADAGRRRHVGPSAGGGRPGQRRQQHGVPAGRRAAGGVSGHRRRRPRPWTARRSSSSPCRHRPSAATSSGGRRAPPRGRGLTDEGRRARDDQADERGHRGGGPGRAHRIVVVSGPNLAREIAAAPAGGQRGRLRRRGDGGAGRHVCVTPWFRPYTNDDVIGIELGGAVKNVMALAVGMADGHGLGDNSKASLITRGLAEMTRLGLGAGRRPAHVRGAGRARRPRRHLHVAAVAQPHLRREARPGMSRGGQARHQADRRGRQVLRVDPRSSRATTASTCRSSQRSSASSRGEVTPHRDGKALMTRSLKSEGAEPAATPSLRPAPGQVGPEVLDVLDADRQPDQPLGHRRRSPPAHRRRRSMSRLHAAEAGRVQPERGRRGDGVGGRARRRPPRSTRSRPSPGSATRSTAGWSASRRGELGGVGLGPLDPQCRVRSPRSASHASIGPAMAPCTARRRAGGSSSVVVAG